MTKLELIGLWVLSVFFAFIFGAFNGMEKGYLQSIDKNERLIKAYMQVPWEKSPRFEPRIKNLEQRCVDRWQRISCTG